MPWPSPRELITLPAEKLHGACLLFAPDSPYQNLYQSFVCGAALADPTLARLYIELGIIHVVVVSGAHLIFLDSLLRSLRKEDTAWTLPFLAFYALVTRFEAPVVRSLLQMVVRRFQKKAQLHWSLPVETTVAGVLTLLIHGPSLSLQLSWVASMGLLSRSSPLITQVRVYALLLPLLATLQMAHPISVMINLALAPLLSAVAFPASLACFFIPPLTPAVDLLWSGAHKIFALLEREFSLGSFPAWSGGFWMWVYVVGLQTYQILGWTWRQRRNV